MKNALKRLALITVGGFAATVIIYWFNLDNKAIYYAVRPLLNKIYARQRRDTAI